MSEAKDVPLDGKVDLFGVLCRPRDSINRSLWTYTVGVRVEPLEPTTFKRISKFHVHCGASQTVEFSVDAYLL